MDDFFIKTDFRFEKYINERLQEISDEGERRVLKDIVKETLIPFYEHSENVYHQLEKNLQQNYKNNDNGFKIITGIEYKDKDCVYGEAPGDAGQPEAYSIGSKCRSKRPCNCHRSIDRRNRSYF